MPTVDARIVEARRLTGRGQRDNARDIYLRILAEEPHHAEALHDLATDAFARERVEFALQLTRRAIEWSPQVASYHHTLGLALARKGDVAGAMAAFAEALRLDPQFVGAYVQSGIVLYNENRLTEARERFLAGLEVQSDALGLRHNLALTLDDLGEHVRAEAIYNELLRIAPERKLTQFCRSLARLRRGDFEGGWQDFESRPVPEPPAVAKGLPTWKGEDLTSGALVLWEDQGLGDTIQFARIPIQADWGKRATVLVSPWLVGLLRGSGARAQSSHAIRAVPAKYQLPLGSLPYVLGFRESICGPFTVPYLRADPTLVRLWEAVLGPKKGKLRVGLVWRGSRANFRDRVRSMPLRELWPLADLQEIEFISLQLGEAEHEAKEWPGEMRRMGDELDQGFHDTAGIAKNLDLIITVDTAVAHLGGALGIPTWILHRRPAEWRWGGGEGCALYPSVRNFHQTVSGSWKEPVELIRSRLEGVLRDPGLLQAPPPPDENVRVQPPEVLVWSPKGAAAVSPRTSRVKGPTVEGRVKQLTELAEELALAHVREETFRFSKLGAFRDSVRFIFRMDALGADSQNKVLRTCARLGMGRAHQDLIEGELHEAGSVGFCFDVSSGQSEYEVFIDFPRRVLQAAPGESFLARLGVVWDPMESTSYLKRYTAWQGLGWDAAISGLANAFSYQGPAGASEVVQRLVASWRDRLPPPSGSFLGVEMSDARGAAFEMNAGRVHAAVRAIERELLEIADRYGIDGGGVHDTLLAMVPFTLTHLGGGVGRDAREFVRIGCGAPQV